MATMQLKEVHWITMQAGDLTFPLVQANVELGDGKMDQNFIWDLYQRSVGMVVATSIICNTSYIPSDLSNWLVIGTTTYGNSQGIKVEKIVRSSGNYRYVDYKVYLNDVQIINGVSPGAYSANKYHLAPVILFTNDDGEVYYAGTRLPYAAYTGQRISFSYDEITAWDVTIEEDYNLVPPAGTFAKLQDINVKDYIKIVSTDPYAGTGDSEESEGTGTFDYSGNPPGGFSDFQFPSISAVDTGFVTLYNPTSAELKALSNYLWSSSFDLNLFKKIVNDPMDLFLGLSIVPVAVPDGGRSEVGIGLIGSGVYMTKAREQWASLACGSVQIPNFTNAYLDYDPYTQIEIYLPYIGVRTLKADEVIGKTLDLHYAIDLLSGACVAWIDIDGHVTYTYMGQCATSIPIVSGDWTNLINGIISIVGSAAGGALKGGVGGAIAGGVAAASSVAVNDSKISVDRAGSISSAGGLLAHPKPFLIISAPRLCKPAGQNLFVGYPDYVTHTLSELAGYTEVEEIRLSGVPGTDEELSELETLLKTGVIL